jgi:hypothetical protein
VLIVAAKRLEKLERWRGREQVIGAVPEAAWK